MKELELGLTPAKTKEEETRARARAAVEEKAEEEKAEEEKAEEAAKAAAKAAREEKAVREEEENELFINFIKNLGDYAFNLNEQTSLAEEHLKEKIIDLYLDNKIPYFISSDIYPYPGLQNIRQLIFGKEYGLTPEVNLKRVQAIVSTPAENLIKRVITNSEDLTTEDKEKYKTFFKFISGRNLVPQ